MKDNLQLNKYKTRAICAAEEYRSNMSELGSKLYNEVPKYIKDEADSLGYIDCDEYSHIRAVERYLNRMILMRDSIEDRYGVNIDEEWDEDWVYLYITQIINNDLFISYDESDFEYMDC